MVECGRGSLNYIAQRNIYINWKFGNCVNSECKKAGKVFEETWRTTWRVRETGQIDCQCIKDQLEIGKTKVGLYVYNQELLKCFEQQLCIKKKKGSINWRQYQSNVQLIHDLKQHKLRISCKEWFYNFQTWCPCARNEAYYLLFLCVVFWYSIL